MYRFGKSEDAQSDKEDEGPNFKTSGKLAAETNTYKVGSIVLLCICLILMHNVGSCYYL